MKPPAAGSARTITLLTAPSAATRGVGVFRITVGRQSWFYTFCELRCDIGGRGFALHKTGLGTLYHVRVGAPPNNSCECMGFLARDTCRHVLGLRALIRQGKLPRGGVG